MKDKSRDIFQDLKKKDEYFWQTNFIYGRQEEKMFFLGVLGKASGDEEMVSHALSRLKVPLWEHRRVGIREVARMPMVEPVEPELRSWMLRDNCN